MIPRSEMLLDTTNQIALRTSRLWRGTALTAVFVLAGGLSLITCRPAHLTAGDPTAESTNRVDATATATQSASETSPDSLGPG